VSDTDILKYPNRVKSVSQLRGIIDWFSKYGIISAHPKKPNPGSLIKAPKTFKIISSASTQPCVLSQFGVPSHEAKDVPIISKPF